METSIIKHFSKITDQALINLSQGKNFYVKKYLKNDVMEKQIQDQFYKNYKEIYEMSGKKFTGFSKETQKLIDEYKANHKDMINTAAQDYKKTLNRIRAAKDDPELRQRILNEYANRGITGHRGVSNWNIETYSNMTYTHTNNEIMRNAVLDTLDPTENKVQISGNSTSKTCEVCNLYEGRVLTLDELEEAKIDGLFHPNCVHYIMPVEE